MTRPHVQTASPERSRRGPATGLRAEPGAHARPRWTPPAFEVIALDCEITAYAPDGGDGPPLF